MAQLLMPLPGKRPTSLINSEGRTDQCHPRGPSLCLTSPEEECATFRDPASPPINLLVEGQRDQVVQDPLAPPQAGEAGPEGATKDDKAPIDAEIWDKMLYLGLSEHARAGPWAQAARTIHPLLARHWRRLQLRKWILYGKKKRAKVESVSEADKEAARRDCLLRLQATTFWEWKSGSRPMFWNYPDDQQVTMRDGIALWIKGRLNPWLVLQRLPRDHDDIPKVIEKLCNARDKG
jgi:hypothetical protein